MPRTALTLAVAATVASLAMAGSMPQPLPTQPAADSSAAVDARRHRGRYGHHGHHHGHHGHDDDDDDGGHHGGDDDCGSLSMASFDSDNGHYMPSAHGRHGRHGEHDDDDDRKIPRHVVAMAAGVALLAFVSALVAVLVCYCKKACCFAAAKTADDDNAPDAPHTLEVVSSAPDYVDEHAVMKKADPLAGSGSLPLPLQVTADGVVIDESSALPGVVATVEVSTPKVL